MRFAHSMWKSRDIWRRWMSKLPRGRSKRNTLEGMIQVVCGINGEQVEFDEELWGGLLDHIVVKGDGAVVVVFKGGIEIRVEG